MTGPIVDHKQDIIATVQLIGTIDRDVQSKPTYEQVKPTRHLDQPLYSGASSLRTQCREAAGISLAESRQPGSKAETGFDPITEGDI